MNMEHHYRIRAAWTGNRGAGTTGFRDYDRLVTLQATGKPDLLASSDKPFRGDPSRWNPEDLLLAALAECHLLSYLHAAVTAGVVVTAYHDDATALLVQGPGNGGRFAEATLRPQVTVAEAAMVPAATQAHGPAHEWCFIAASVNFPIHIQPQVVAEE